MNFSSFSLPKKNSLYLNTKLTLQKLVENGIFFDQCCQQYCVLAKCMVCICLFLKFYFVYNSIFINVADHQATVSTNSGTIPQLRDTVVEEVGMAEHCFV
jgi:hypothetical protein